MTDNAQRAFAAGFGLLMVPVTAPGEPFGGSLKAQSMGKAPGHKRNGVWFPVPVPGTTCRSPEEARSWDLWEANVGVGCGRALQVYALDSDADDPGVAQVIEAVIQSKVFEPLSRGVAAPGHHRRLYPFRLQGLMLRGSSLRFEKTDGTGFTLDLLGEGRQFVAWGTHPGTGKPYCWNGDPVDTGLGPESFPLVTSTLVGEILQAIEQELLALGWRRVSGAQGMNPTLHLGSLHPRTATERELSRWLGLVPNGDKDTQFDAYGEWVAMAHAIWAASEHRDWGRELWLRWCDQRPQAPGEAIRVWDSIRSSRVDLDWIRARARDRNAKLAAQLDFELAPPPPADLIDAIVAGGAEGLLWPHILPRYAFIASQDRIYDLVTCQTYTRGGFDGLLGHLAQALRQEAFPSLRGERPPSWLLARHPDALKAHGATYWPGRPRLTQDSDGAVLINRWREPNLPARPVSAADVKPWLDHVLHVCKTQDNADLFVKYLAMTVKCPDEKANWHPLIQTVPGIGKDTLLLPVIEAIGENNMREVTGDDLANQWTDFLESRLIYVSETRQHARGQKSSHDVMNDLKPMLTTPPTNVWCNHKGKGKYRIPNLTMWVFFSNESLPVFLAEGDRRIWVIDNLSATPQPESYYETLHTWLRDHPGWVGDYLRSYPLTAQDIRAFKGTAPDTTAKQSLILANRDPLVALLEDFIDDARHGIGFPSCVVALEDVEAALRQHLKHVPTRGQVARALKQLGAVPVTSNFKGEAGLVRLDSGNARKRLWVLAPTDEGGHDYRGITPAVAGKLYTSGKWPSGSATRTTVTGVTLASVGTTSNDDTTDIV